MLCRSCGGEMSATEYCDSCNEGIVWKCGSCEKENDKSIHTFHQSLETLSTSVSTVLGAILCLAGSFAVSV